MPPDPRAELASNLHLAASFARRAADQQDRLGQVLLALQTQSARLAAAAETDSAVDPSRAYVCLGAAAAALEQVRQDIASVAAHLGQVATRLAPGEEGAGSLICTPGRRS